MKDEQIVTDYIRATKQLFDEKVSLAVEDHYADVILACNEGRKDTVGIVTVFSFGLIPKALFFGEREYIVYDQGIDREIILFFFLVGLRSKQSYLFSLGCRLLSMALLSGDRLELACFFSCEFAKAFAKAKDPILRLIAFAKDARYEYAVSANSFLLAHEYMHIKIRREGNKKKFISEEFFERTGAVLIKTFSEPPSIEELWLLSEEVWCDMRALSVVIPFTIGRGVAPEKSLTHAFTYICAILWITCVHTIGSFVFSSAMSLDQCRRKIQFNRVRYGKTLENLVEFVDKGTIGWFNGYVKNVGSTLYENTTRCVDALLDVGAFVKSNMNPTSGVAGVFEGQLREITAALGFRVAGLSGEELVLFWASLGSK